MKYLRYIIIALLVYLFVFSVRSFVFPTAKLASGAVYEGHDLGDIVAQYRTTMLPMLALIGALFVGWLFPAKKLVVSGVLAIGIPIFAYLAYSSISSLGFTPGQSFLAIIQGYGASRVGWLLFYLVALIALPFAYRMKTAEQAVTPQSATRSQFDFSA